MASRLAASMQTRHGSRAFRTQAVGSPAASSRFASTIPFPATGGEKTEKGAVTGSAGGKKDEKAVASYWGVDLPKIVRDDGTEWKWSCFRPWETYTSDTSIDLKKHHVPVTWGDKLALWTVKSLRWPTDIFFQRNFQTVQ